MANKYADKLKSPLWQKKRLEIFNLHNFKCEKCGEETKELHVHHRFYLKGREPREYDNDVFQVLCRNCHKKEHDEKTEIIGKIPEEYLQIIDSIEKIKNKDGMAIFSIKTFLSYILEKPERTYLTDLVVALCCTEIGAIVEGIVGYSKNMADTIEELRSDMDKSADKK